MTDIPSREPGAGPDDGPPVGLVVGTVDATPLTWHVAVGPDQYLQLDDVVVVSRGLPGRPEPVTVSGVVTQVRATHKDASSGRTYSPSQPARCRRRSRRSRR